MDVRGRSGDPSRADIRPGYLIMYAYNQGQMNVIIAGMITIGVIGLAIDQLFKIVETRLFSWRGLDR